MRSGARMMRAVWVLLPAALALACGGGTREASQARSGADARRYPLAGRVVAVDAERGALRIDHEAIPGYMEAMTMRFPVKDPAQMAGISAGDAVTATLVVAPDNTYWLEDLKRVPAPGRDRGQVLN